MREMTGTLGRSAGLERKESACGRLPPEWLGEESDKRRLSVAWISKSSSKVESQAAEKQLSLLTA